MTGISVSKALLASLNLEPISPSFSQQLHQPQPKKTLTMSSNLYQNAQFFTQPTKLKAPNPDSKPYPETI